ncbi:dermonecrotic toxin domain-containing protein [Pseudomonas sp. FEN]|uniref:dermonecrotic toxin domain-containing protein n=1 Tax=Pseudomonas sp. FEN TaxID=2767468 RepID=UPI00174D4A64|nr:DUF6543 domain-containing protein [Pseudomonas sp. FEN]
MTDAITPPRSSLEQEIDAAKALFAHPPTLRGVALSVIQERFFTHWDPRRNATQLMVGEPQWSEQHGQRVFAGYRYSTLLDLVLKHFTAGVAAVFTEAHVLEPWSEGGRGNRYLVDAAATQTMLREWGEVLLELFKQALVDYWNEEDAQGTSRFRRLCALLVRILAVDREQYRDFLTVDLEKPEEQFALHGLRAVSKDSWGARYPEALPVLIARRKTRGIEQVPLVFSLAWGMFKAGSTDLGQLVPLFMSTRANGRDIEYREHLLWQQDDPPEQIEEAICSLGEALLDNQLQEIALIGRDSAWTVEDYQRRLDAITRPDRWFFTPVARPAHVVVELPEELAALRDALPYWLLGARAEDITAYRALLEQLAEVQRASGGKAFLDGVGDLPGFAAKALLKKMREDHPQVLGIADPDDIHLQLEKTVALAVPSAGAGGGALGSVETVRMSLTEFALENLGGFRHAQMRINIRRCALEAPVPAWMTPDYLKGVVSAVDIGRTYLELLQSTLIEDVDEARRREQLFSAQLRVQLPMVALELKIRGEADFDETGYRYVEAVMQADAARQWLDGQQIVLRPLAFKSEADASADVVASMFLIGPQDTRHGPVILYRPLLAKAGSRESAFQTFQSTPGKAFCPRDNDVRPTPSVETLRQYPSFDALFEAIKHPGQLQEHVLTWMSDQARRTYDNGGFVEPHLPRSFEDDFATLWPVGPATLSDEVVEGDYLHHLFVSTARSLIALADRQSVSNAEQRWATLKEGGWQLFNVLLMFIRGPAALAGWIFAVVASVEADLRRLQEKDPGTKASAWADILVNMAFILGHRLGHLQAPVETPGRIPTHESYRAPVRASISEGADRLQSMQLDNSLSPGATSLRRSPRDWAMKRYPMPWPESHTLGEVIASGEYKGLIRLKEGKRLAARVGGWLFAVATDAESNVRVTTADGLEQGFYLKSLGDGRWLPDLRLRLRGGSGRGGRETIKQMQAKNAAAAKALDERHRLIETDGKLAMRRASIARLDLQRKEAGDYPAVIRSEARQRFLQEARKAFDLTGQSISVREEQARLKPVAKWKEAVCAFLGVQLGGCREQLDVLARVREEGHPSAEDLALAQATNAGPGSALYERLLAYQVKKVKINDEMLDWHRQEKRIDAHLGEFPGLGAKTRDKVNAETRGVGTLLDTQSSQLQTLRWLSIHELERGERTYPSLREKTQEATMASRSRVNLELDTEISARRRRRVLNTCIENYESSLQVIEFWRYHQPAGRSVVYTERLVGLIGQLREEALEALSELLDEQASDVAAQEGLEKVPGLIQTRGSRGGTYLGKVRPASAGQTREIVEISGGDEVLLFQENDEGTYWEEVSAPESAPQSVAAKPLIGIKRLLGDAEAQMQAAKRELLDARAELTKALDKAERLKQPIRDPVYLQDVLESESKKLERLANQLEERLASVDATIERVNGQTQVGKLRALALELVNAGLLIRVEATKASMPDMARVDFLQRQGAIEIRKNGPRSLLKSRDYLQEYLILDKAATGRKNALLWVAHFHYEGLATFDDGFELGAAHLKTREERFLGSKAQAHAEGERFERIRRGQPGRAQAAVDIWRSAISLPMARKFFFNAPEVEEALVEQLKRL